MQSYEATWRRSDPDGVGSMVAGAWQNASGDDADCASNDDPGAANDCGEDVGNVLVCTIASLTATTGYDVRVRAINGNGNGPWSAVQKDG